MPPPCFAAVATADDGQSVAQDVTGDPPRLEHLPLESGPRAGPDNEVRATTGIGKEAWRQAAIEDAHGSFYRMGAVSVATATDIARVGRRSGILPMKAVWARKSDRFRRLALPVAIVPGRTRRMPSGPLKPKWPASGRACGLHSSANEARARWSSSRRSWRPPYQGTWESWCARHSSV